jgi:hypothetical protein
MVKAILLKNRDLIPEEVMEEFTFKLHQPKRKMGQDYLFLYILKLCFR